MTVSTQVKGNYYMDPKSLDISNSALKKITHAYLFEL